MKREEVLKIEDFSMSFGTGKERVEAVRGVSLSVSAGEILALVGASGCGKTALCRAVMMLHARHAQMKSGRILLCGNDVTKMSEKELQAVRGRDVAMIFQDPMSSLDPVYTIGRHIMEPLMVHEKISVSEAARRAVVLLEMTGITEAHLRLSQYPHHFSGGMRQRVAIAIALALQPRLLIADEPTTALDPEARVQIVDLLKRICRETGCGMLFVTHDLGMAQKLANRTAVMKDGVIVEEAETEVLFSAPQHPYTKELLRYVECGKSMESSGQNVAEQLGQFERKMDGGIRSEILHVCGLSKSFVLGKGHVQKVLSDFSMTAATGEIIAVTGPSGCGKTTLAKCLAGIYKPDSGTIEFVKGCRTQMIFQDSASALNPRMKIWELIAEPLVISAKRQHRHLDRALLREKVFQAMEQAELSVSLWERYPYDVSGGQRQRAAIARALITEPDFLIADEPVSSLDVSTQAQIIQLLKKIQADRNLTMVLISHNLAMTSRISDRMIAMSLHG